MKQNLMKQKNIINSTVVENSRYFYIGDHLGSASWITDMNGTPVQYLSYDPFGSQILNQKAVGSTFDSDYKFNAKPLDTESGFYNYGARMYDPALGIWLSVDPLSEKFPFISPFAFCLNNPLKYIDPDGRTPWPILKLYNEATRKISSGFYRNSGGSFHGGVDIVHAANGSISGGEIVATHNGIVTAVGTSENGGAAGNWIQITNGDIRTSYMHMENAPTQQLGDKISEFDPVGTVGNTGRSEAPHLHYQIEQYNSETNKWDKINPVEGGLQKVDLNMDVELKDPQKIINNRLMQNYAPLEKDLKNQY